MTEKQNNEQNKVQPNPSMNFALIGGVVGAGIGLLSSPGTSKKVMSSIGQSEVVRAAGTELRRTAQQIITEQAMMTLRQTAAGYWSKSGGTLLGLGKEEDSNDTKDTESDDRYKELKEENQNLNEQLQRIEEKLNALLEAKEK